MNDEAWPTVTWTTLAAGLVLLVIWAWVRDQHR